MANNINDEILELFKKAEESFSNNSFLKASDYYNKILLIDERNHEAYFGLYLSWYQISKQRNNYEVGQLVGFLRNAIKFAPSKKKEEYLNIWDEDYTKFYHMEDKTDERK